ncbi:hypothetical protein Syun_012009 [Stephania yunnanensis]|uniref:Programmed cell death protein 2 C-terminal domain-containing protein n=1 Tax=Stephania yunnanensis TaxID=152371 RepID=A0AAP0JZE3_9MAGN
MEIEVKDNSLNFKSLNISFEEEDVEEEEGQEEQEFDDEEDENKDEVPVTLGFVEKPKNHYSLIRHFFPSKAGGAPVYAPIIYKESTFHRTLFVFMCTSIACLLQDHHEQWKRRPENRLRSCLAQILSTQLLFVSGVVHGKEIRYVVAAEVLIIALKSIRSSIGVSSSDMWPEFEIICDDEPEFDTEASNCSYSNSLVSKDQMDDTMNSLMSSFEGTLIREARLPFKSALLELLSKYARDVKARPLWPMSIGQPSKADIPNYNYCNGPLCYEFQILPQLLYYFGVKNDVNSLDWGTIVVYACADSCDASMSYKEEFAWVQLSSSTVVVP